MRMTIRTMSLLVSLTGGLAATAQKLPQSMDLPVIQEPHFKNDTVNILQYGAKAGGIVLNTKSINDAINACNARGGGVVLIPGGLWLSGPVTLRSNVNLHLARTAILVFTADYDQYPLVRSYWHGFTNSYRVQPFIDAADQENIAITGSGVINGNGSAWGWVRRDKLTVSQWKKLVASGGYVSKDEKRWYPTQTSRNGDEPNPLGKLKPGQTVEDLKQYKDYLRPFLLNLLRCKKILLQGVTFEDSPAWCLHPILCSNLTVREITVKNPWYRQNGDGLDVESCNHVLIENNTFMTGDDAICLKSGLNDAGRARGVPTQDVIVRDNIVYQGHGGFVIGSEMSGDVRNVYVYGCSFIGTDVGLRFKTKRGRGGMVENIYISDINMKEIKGEAIRFDMYYNLSKDTKEKPRPVTEETPQFREFYLNNVNCMGAGRAILLRGLPEMNFKSIHLYNMILMADKGLQCIEGTGVSLKNVQLITKDADPVIDIQNAKEVSLDNIGYRKNTKLLMSLYGDNKDIRVSNTDVSAAHKTIEFKEGSDASMIRIDPVKK